MRAKQLEDKYHLAESRFLLTLIMDWSVCKSHSPITNCVWHSVCFQGGKKAYFPDSKNCRSYAIEKPLTLIPHASEYVLSCTWLPTSRWICLFDWIVFQEEVQKEEQFCSEEEIKGFCLFLTWGYFLRRAASLSFLWDLLVLLLLLFCFYHHEVDAGRTNTVITQIVKFVRTRGADE